MAFAEPNEALQLTATQDLGLGVLEEKDANAHDSSATDGDEDMHDGDKEEDVLGKLLGRAGVRDAVSIQEVQDAQHTS